MEAENLTEAQRVAKRERQPRKQYPSDRNPRLGTHINWNHKNDRDLFYCAAFKRMRHGEGKQVLIRFMDMLIPPDCRDIDEAERLMLCFLRARDNDARATLLGIGETEYQPRMTVEEAQAQKRRKGRPAIRRPPAKPAASPAAIEELLRLVQQLVQAQRPVVEKHVEEHVEEHIEEEEPEWESIEAQPAPREYPQPAETPPPELVAPRPYRQTSMPGLMGGPR